MVPIYALDFGQELINMVIQDFIEAHGTKMSTTYLTNKEGIMIWGKEPNSWLTRSTLVILIPKYTEKIKFYFRKDFYEYHLPDK